MKKVVSLLLFLLLLIPATFYGHEDEKDRKYRKEKNCRDDKDRKEKEKKHLFKFIKKNVRKEIYYYPPGKSVAVLPIPPLGKILEFEGAIFISENGKYHCIASGEDGYAIEKNGTRTSYNQYFEGWPAGCVQVHKTCKVYSHPVNILQGTIENVRPMVTVTNSGYLIAFTHGDIFYDIYDLSGNRMGTYKELIWNYRGDAGVGNAGTLDKPRWVYIDFKTGNTRDLSWIKPSYNEKDRTGQGDYDLHYFALLDSGHLVQATTFKEDGKFVGELVKYDLNGNPVLRKRDKRFQLVISLERVGQDLLYINGLFLVDSSFRIIVSNPAIPCLLRVFCFERHSGVLAYMDGQFVGNAKPTFYLYHPTTISIFKLSLESDPNNPFSMGKIYFLSRDKLLVSFGKTHYILQVKVSQKQVILLRKIESKRTDEKEQGKKRKERREGENDD